MLVSNRLFLDKLKKVFKPKPKREKPAPQRRIRKLELIELEDRTLPSLFGSPLEPVIWSDSLNSRESLLGPALVGPLLTDPAVAGNNAVPAAGDPNFTDVGPAPQIGFDAATQKFSGRITSQVFAMGKDGKETLYIGAAGGGVWRSSNFRDAEPRWEHLTDMLGLDVLKDHMSTGVGAGAIDIGALAKADVTIGGKTFTKYIYAGTGEANFGWPAITSTRYGTGVLRFDVENEKWELFTGDLTDGTKDAFFRQAHARIEDRFLAMAA